MLKSFILSAGEKLLTVIMLLAYIGSLFIAYGQSQTVTDMANYTVGTSWGTLLFLSALYWVLITLAAYTLYLLIDIRDNLVKIATKGE